MTGQDKAFNEFYERLMQALPWDTWGHLDETDWYNSKESVQWIEELFFTCDPEDLFGNIESHAASLNERYQAKYMAQ